MSVFLKKRGKKDGLVATVNWSVITMYSVRTMTGARVEMNITLGIVCTITYWLHSLCSINMIVDLSFVNSWMQKLLHLAY
jgi:hypothetical protein